MTLETFFERFDQFADAPDSVAKIRALVLQLAVQGKLIEQIPTDEPADKLVELIRKNKRRLISERTIGRQNSDPVRYVVPPFTIPESWVWTSLGEVGDWGSGSTPARGNHDFYDGGTTWLKSGELNDNQALAVSAETVTELALKTGSFRRNQPGDVLFAMYGATIGKVAILAEPAVTNQAVCGCTPSEGVSNRYLFNYLLSQRAAFHEASEGGAQPNLSKVKIVAFPFPLPPLAEQKRIVAKVDELMALCDQLEAQQQDRDARHAVLARAALARFSDAPTPANLQLLFHPSYAISPADLRKSILTLAVRGRLVPQDPNDEPAEALLESIGRERLAALKANRLGPIKPLQPVEEDEVAYDVRPGWTLARLIDLVMEFQTGPFGSSLHQSDYQVGGTPVINPASLKDGKIVPIEAMAISPHTLKRLAVFRLNEGDIVMARRGEMGRCAIVTNSEAGWLCGTGSLVLRMPTRLHAPFLAMLIGAPEAREYLGGASVGTTMQNLNQGILAKMPVGVPPVAEQRRIVAKVDQLMALVDELETQLAASKSTAANLLTAVVAELTSFPLCESVSNRWLYSIRGRRD